MPVIDYCFLKTWLLSLRIGKHGEEKNEKKKPEFSVMCWFPPAKYNISTLSWKESFIQMLSKP